MEPWFSRKKRGNAKPREERDGRPPAALVVDGWPAGRKVPVGNFPHFRLTANDRIDPAESDVHARTRMKFLEAFTPSQPVSDRKRFAGRLDILTSLIRAIEEKRQHVVLYGARGLGKTSVTHVLAQTAREARYLVVYLSCGADSNFDDVIRAVAANVPMLFYNAVNLTSPDVEKGKTLADILPPVPISPRFASDLFARIVGTRVVVLLDEFDRCDVPLFRRNIAELIKNLSDRHVRVQFIVAGVATDLVELLEHSPSIQRSIFPLQVPTMTGDEVKLLIKNGQELSGVRFADAATNVIVKAAHGSPYLASLLSHHAGITALEGGRIEVNAADAIGAASAAMAEFKNRLSSRVAGELGKLIQERYVGGLGALASSAMSHGGTFQARDLRAPAIASDVAERCNDLIGHLVQDGVLIVEGEKEAKCYRFSDDNITHYLWLMSVEAQFRDKHPAGPAPGASAAVA